MLIDFSLHFDKYIENIIKKAPNVSKLILSSFSTRDQNILIKAFCTYVRPILEYNSPVWSLHRKSLTDRIEKIQKRFTKAIPTLPSSLHAKTETTQITFLRKTSFAGTLLQDQKSPYTHHNSSHQLKLFQNPRPQSQIDNQQIVSDARPQNTSFATVS